MPPMQAITVLSLLSLLSLASADGCWPLDGKSDDCSDWALHNKPYQWLCSKGSTAGLNAGQGCEPTTNGQAYNHDSFCVSLPSSLLGI
ncbi:hypothetical protein Tdes44962_MAKER08491 [Teratosphaeria destructans]|uniref:Secreted protein n=1 Tax=Teratosphaeria destructans TaxID=418781 RepID=A0A9W7SW62_9PEZI|nr:hypothetical protein Tdes44962_MAKER08491 [Teratosphaeria destructans]